MAEENTPVAGAGTEPGQPELVDVVFNNQTVTVTKAHAAILQDAEKNLKQASYQKFEDAKKEREEVERIAGLMQQDADFFNTHDPSLYKQYEMLANGGRGFLGDESLVNPAMSGNIYNPDDEVKSNAVIDSLKAEVKGLKDMVNNVIQKDEKTAVTMAIDTKNDMLNEFKIKPGTTMDVILTNQLKAFHADNKRAATPNEAKAMITSVLNEMGTKTAQPPSPPSPKTGGTPPASGVPPAKPPTPKLDFRGADGFERYKEHMATHLEEALK